MLEYTETVYKHQDQDLICRILDEMLICVNGLMKDGVLILTTKGDKIAMSKMEFNETYELFKLGDSPAASIDMES